MEQQTAVAVQETAAPVVSDSSIGSLMMNETLLTRIEGIAKRMATAKATIPDHLKGNEGDCFAVVMQAVQWGMNPYVVAQKTHTVNGTLGYEAQLVNAVINSLAPVQGRLEFEWYGNWAGIDGKQCVDSSIGVRAWATLKGEEQPRVIDVSMAQAGVRNSPLWKDDPRQQLAYLAIKRWARLYCPDVILGVYTDDEIRSIPEKDVSPKKPSASRADAVKEKLKPQARTPESTEPIEGEAEVVPVPSKAEVVEAINNAETPAQLQAALDMAQDYLGVDGNEKDRSAIGQVYTDRVAVLKANQGGDDAPSDSK